MSAYQLGNAPNLYNADGSPAGQMGLDGKEYPVSGGGALVNTYMQWGCAVGIAPSGSVAANGALTLGTSLGYTHTDGLWLYFPAGAVQSGSAAGFYWVVMSSVTAGTIFANTYTPATDLSPSIPSSTTAISAAGPGAYTGVTATEITVATVSIPAGVLGTRGRLNTDYLARCNNSAGVKSVFVRYGGTLATQFDLSTSTGTRQGQIITARGRTDRQLAQASSTASYSLMSGTPNRLSVDSTQAQTLTFSAQIATATDWLVYEEAAVTAVLF